MRPCLFTCDGCPVAFPGLTDDTHWNGWLNVRVTPATHAEVCEYLRDHAEESGLRDLVPGPDDLVSYHGFTMYEVEPADHPAPSRRNA